MFHLLFSLSPDAIAWRTRWIFTILAITAVVWGWYDVRYRGRLEANDPGAHMTDFTCYTEAGAAFFDGRDPYQVTNSRGWGYPYPPLFALLVAPLASLDTQTQVLFWYVISLFAVWGCYRESRRLWSFAIGVSSNTYESPLTPPFLLWLPWIAALTVALPVLNCLQRGQVGVVKAYLLILGLRLVLNAKSWRGASLAGVVLALPIVLKVTPILPVAVLLFGLVVRSYYAVANERVWSKTVGTISGVAMGMLLFVLVIPTAMLGWNANQRHLTTWYQEIATRANDLGGADRTGNTRTIRNQSLSNALYRCGNWLMFEFAAGPNDLLADDDQHYVRGTLPMDAPLIERIILYLRLGLVGLSFVTMGLMARRRDELGLATAFGLAMAATLIVSPIGRGHYYMLLLPAVYLAPLWFYQRDHRRLAWFVALLPLLLCVAHYVALDVTGRLGVLGIGTTVWLVVVSIKLMGPIKMARDPSLGHPTSRATYQRFLHSNSCKDRVSSVDLLSICRVGNPLAGRPVTLNASISSMDLTPDQLHPTPHDAVLD